MNLKEFSDFSGVPKIRHYFCEFDDGLIFCYFEFVFSWVKRLYHYRILVWAKRFPKVSKIWIQLTCISGHKLKCISILFYHYFKHFCLLQEFGVQRELIDLCRLTCLNGQRARVLFNAGIDSICVLANSKIEDIENILQNCAPFERY